MPREPKCRRVAFEPVITLFNPQGVPSSELEQVILKIEELEAIRLKDYLVLDQEESAITMGVSRPTFQRILTEAHAKIAEALISGKAIRIEGGNYCFGGGFCRRNARPLENEEDCPFFDDMTLKQNANHTLNTKIAICSSGQTSDSVIADHFGRSSYFLIYDPTQQSFYVSPHTGREAVHGAGANAAGKLLSEGIGVIVTKQIGPRAFAAMQHLGIDVYTMEETSTVEKALEKYLDHQLKQLFNANNP